ncbi:hypothetical protein Sste5346_005612 [Sporothrix stenoceras]|uniref:Calcineurin-like phosphoesterase domain-containing protein n=1 Tax=Sporothrix stenoceras TaxID=5173 RepID=A0ABR3Z2S1_9PEZI
MKAFSKLASRLSIYKTDPVEPTQKTRKTTAPPEPSPPQENGPIQVLSDLHLELCKQYLTFEVPKTTANYLILAGDIGRFVDYEPLLGFLEKLVPSYKRIFYLLGNHEFYTMTYEQGIQEAYRMEKEPTLQGKVTILHRTRWDEDSSDSSDAAIPNFTILGCTLWTHVPPESREAVGRAISDFKYIQDWTVDSHNQMHDEEVTWLREQVAALRSEDPSRTLLVVTHHVPTVEGTSRPKYSESPWATAFATELILQDKEEEKPWDGVAAWIYGHTHYSNDFVRGGVRLIANQRGYVFPPNPNIVKAEDAKDRSGKSEKGSFRIIERKAHQDEEEGLHAFNASRTIAL